ncbi:glycosyltransferase [Candidatus Wolfebacteria bacterium]|nr:glycosyltransferase [Candidatus Wolfebacteria bacterium]
MKILHITPTYFPAIRYGGPIKSVHELNKWLVKKGVEVIVYTTNADGPSVLDVPVNQPVDVDGVKVFYFKNFFSRWFYSFKMHQAIAKNVKNFDIVHITGVFLAISTLGAHYARKYKKPYVISPRGVLMKEPLKRKAFKKRFYLSLVEKNNLAKASAIHFTAELEREEYIKENLPLKNSILVPNCFDSSEFDEAVAPGYLRQKFKIPADKKIILFLSRLSWKKGFDTLIPAFAEVVKKEPKAVLVIAGGDDEEYKKEIDKFIEKNGVKNKVIFTGLVRGKDKIAAYQDSDVFVLPSYSENFGNVVFEALYFGLPVVITKNVAVYPEIERVGGGIVINKNIKELSSTILKILENKEFGRKLGEAGRKMVIGEFSPKGVADKLFNEYQKLAGKNKKEPISVIILTYNEELNIENCLKKVAEWCDEIFVVDSYSTDKTLEIAKKYGAKIAQRPFKNQAEQFNWALDNLDIKNEWVLRLDADEYLTDELKNEITEKLENTPNNISGFYLRRRVYFMGRWIKHGGYYPIWLLRLFRYGKARYQEERNVDEHLSLLEGVTGKMKNDFIDDNKKDLTWWIKKHNSYASREAGEIIKQPTTNNQQLTTKLGGQPERKSWLRQNLYLKMPMFFRACVYFVYRYFFRLGFLDGKEGLIFHFLQGFWYRFLVDAKIYERKKYLHIRH